MSSYVKYKFLIGMLHKVGCGQYPSDYYLQTEVDIYLLLCYNSSKFPAYNDKQIGTTSSV